ncbi:hypothetical protein RSSM_03399 [Rhodopirellula sallentina SM41]|uniref:Uncharacterized protein n=1 Tax=Rhodopirellula sallentina SM41 TaxID=1263870 RepID=M5U0V2_9BACT|nr:hypothetical protein RSSM_03399 [Rhodopirellula sallentina SM41]
MEKWLRRRPPEQLRLGSFQRVGASFSDTDANSAYSFNASNDATSAS